MWCRSVIWGPQQRKPKGLLCLYDPFNTFSTLRQLPTLTHPLCDNTKINKIKGIIKNKSKKQEKELPPSSTALDTPALVKSLGTLNLPSLPLPCTCPGCLLLLLEWEEEQVTIFTPYRQWERQTHGRHPPLQDFHTWGLITQQPPPLKETRNEE